MLANDHRQTDVNNTRRHDDHTVKYLKTAHRIQFIFDLFITVQFRTIAVSAEPQRHGSLGSIGVRAERQW